MECLHRDLFSPCSHPRSQCSPRKRTGFIWVYEVKLDDFRCIAVRGEDRASLYSRSGNSLTDRFSEIAHCLTERLVPGTTLDGEIVALDERGLPSFNLLQNGGVGGEVVFYIFDIQPSADGRWCDFLTQSVAPYSKGTCIRRCAARCFSHTRSQLIHNLFSASATWALRASLRSGWTRPIDLAT